MSKPIKNIPKKTTNSIAVTDTAAWQELVAHKQRMQKITIKELFVQDANRFENFSFQANDFLYDISKQRVDNEVMQSLFKLTEECELKEHIKSLYRGDVVNYTENRPALHTKLRLLQTDDAEIKAVRQKMEAFVTGIHAGTIVGCTGKAIKHVISLGIGGSELGPRMACTALKKFKTKDLDIHFVANVDAETLADTLSKVEPDRTICLVNSKTFTTPETLENAKVVKAWLQQHLGRKSLQQIYAVTANLAKAVEFGIDKDNTFAFWDWVGGRYSVWSAVGLPLALQIGFEQFREFLAGAQKMDQHFYETEFSANLPVIMGLIGIWNINHLNYNTLAIIPYLDGLESLPAYLQQLEMESNGKIASNLGDYVSYATAPIIWGGVGCNGQHAYMQLLHQGSQVVPVDFIAAVNSHGELAGNGSTDLQNLLLASCLSQSKALMEGRNETELHELKTITSQATNGLDLIKAKVCPGNRPSSSIFFPSLTPKILGNLIAWYEHKVFVQGIVWQIQSFDQWGVELGKQLAKQLLPRLKTDAAMDSSADMSQLDSSSAGLLAYIKQNRH